MGKFTDKMDSRRDTYVVAKVDVGAWLGEFVLEYSKAQTHSERDVVVRAWFG